MFFIHKLTQDTRDKNVIVDHKGGTLFAPPPPPSSCFDFCASPDVVP